MMSAAGHASSRPKGQAFHADGGAKHRHGGRRSPPRPQNPSGWRKLAAADAIIHAAAERHGDILTCDARFKGLPHLVRIDKKTDPHVTQVLDGGPPRLYHKMGNGGPASGTADSRHVRTGPNSMAKMTISLPDSLADYVARRVASGRYESPDAFLAELIVKDQDHRKLDDDELRDILRQAEESGISDRRILDILLETKAKLRDNYL